MHFQTKPLQVVVYEDVLCGWCFLLEKRLQPLRSELGDAVVWKSRPYPLRPRETSPGAKDTREWLAEIERAAREPDGGTLRADLWNAGDVPRSSLPPLCAL